MTRLPPPRSVGAAGAEAIDKAAEQVTTGWAAALALTIGSRLQGLLHIGAPLAVFAVPAVVRRLREQPDVRWPRVILGLFVATVLAMPMMAILGQLVDPDRGFSATEFLKDFIRITSLALVVVGILWSCLRIRPEWVMALVAAGIAVRYIVFPDVSADELFKFRLGPTLPFILLAVVARAPRPVQLVALAVVAAMSAYFNLRASLLASAIGFVALGATMLVPFATRRRRPTMGTTIVALLLTGLAMGVGGLVVPQMAEDGVFGADIQHRQISQEVTGVGVFGARIEPGASLALVQHQPLGLGPGVLPSQTDRGVAWDGLIDIGVNPNGNDFNAHYMRDIVANRIFLHSNLAEFWWFYGPVGAALIVAIAIFMGLRFIEQLGREDRYLCGLVLYASMRSVWDCFFEPVLPIGTNLMVTTGFLLCVHLLRRADAGAAAGPGDAAVSEPRHAQATWSRTHLSTRAAKRSAENSPAASRMALRSRPAARRTASATVRRSSQSLTRWPARPSVTDSAVPPTDEAITGHPAAIASTGMMPKSSTGGKR